jgi:hypothetical protein
MILQHLNPALTGFPLMKFIYYKEKKCSKAVIMVKSSELI